MQQPILALVIAGVIAISTIIVPAQADARDYRRDDHRGSHDGRRYEKRGSHDGRRYDKRSGYDKHGRYDKHRGHGKHKKSKHVKSPIIHRGHGGHGHHVPSHRIRHHRDIVVVRPYGHLYHGYGHYYHDDDAYKWLAFTAIAVKLLDNLNEHQQREHEAAQIRATTAPIGETIYWSEGRASGYVTPTREGTSSSGRYCREFQHEVTIAGKREQSYGTACRQPDGSWEVISTGQ